MRRRKELLATGAAGLAVLALSFGLAGADHIRIEVSPPQEPSSSTTVIVPAPAAPQPTVPQTLHADEIQAQQVRADTIYANRIEADEIRGQIHQTKEVKIKDSRGKIKAPDVTASIIYADEISANSVVAQHVYVRDLRRR